MNFNEEFKTKIEKTDDFLKETLCGNGEVPEEITEAMNYSVFAGGKRIRPVLMIAACELFGGKAEDIKEFVCAIEMIHTYSLIHDDLPAMDNSPLRRGRKTNHIVYGEAMAILAGDGLLNMAFETMAKCSLDAGRVLRAAACVGKYSGCCGMIGGQVIDILNEGKTVDVSVLKKLHLKKTAALLCASACAGAILAGAEEEDVLSMCRYAENLGLAFQIKDDILDVTGDAAKLGKPTGNDEVCEKNTYVSLLGLEKANELLKTYSENAKKELQKYSEKSEFLNSLTDFLLKRDY